MTRVHALTVLFLVASGGAFALEKLHRVNSEPMSLRVPFDRFPMDIFGPAWKGRDVPMEPGVLKIASVDSYIQRSYTDGKLSLHFYVGFAEGWKPSSVHHPAICFPGGGWELQRKEVVPVPFESLETGASAVEVPIAGRPAALFNEYLWTKGLGERQYTLTTFYFNGKFVPEEDNLWWARFTGVHYITIITISGNPVGWGTIEEQSRASRVLYVGLLQKALPKLLEHLPQ